MTGKELKHRLRSGKRVYGTMIVSTSPKWLDIIDQLNLDFVFIDTEHIAIDRELLSWMCHGYNGKGLLPIVRIPSPDPYQACMVLDAGAKGLVAPYIESVDEVKQLQGAVKYRPLKGQKLSDFINGKSTLEPGLAEYLERHNDNNVMIINIESRTGIENLDEMLKVPGLDAVLVGPHDLSCNLGIPEQYDHPEFLDAVEKIIRKARNTNIGAGVHAFFEGCLEREIYWAEMGANFIMHSGDIQRFTQALSDDINKLRSALHDGFKDTDRTVNI